MIDCSFNKSDQWGIILTLHLCPSWIELKERSLPRYQHNLAVVTQGERICITNTNVHVKAKTPALTSHHHITILFEKKKNNNRKHNLQMHFRPRTLNSSQQQDYLRRFYNLNPGDGGRVSGRSIRSTSAVEEKIREMQNFFGLRETGRLDHHTLDVMREPRCGVPDVENFSFYPGKPKWRNPTITYMWDVSWYLRSWLLSYCKKVHLNKIMQVVYFIFRSDLIFHCCCCCGARCSHYVVFVCLCEQDCQIHPRHEESGCRKVISFSPEDVEWCSTADVQQSHPWQSRHSLLLHSQK